MRLASWRSYLPVDRSQTCIANGSSARGRHTSGLIDLSDERTLAILKLSARGFRATCYIACNKCGLAPREPHYRRGFASIGLLPSGTFQVSRAAPKAPAEKGGGNGPTEISCCRRR